jgi:transposase-like protein
MTLTGIARMTDDEARLYLEQIRWPDGPSCPHCESKRVTRMNGNAHRAGTFQCNECRSQFTATVGSVMEDSHIPLAKWILAFHLLCSSKKGFSALQMKRELGLGSYRTALFMLHRIREAMSGPLEQALQGVVEMDETYVGGKPRPGDGKVHKRGRGTSKTPVVAVVERDGEARSEPVAHVDTKTLKAIAKENVNLSAATLATDEYPLYGKIGQEFDGGHIQVDHGAGEYVNYKTGRGVAAHTNTAESYFSLLKRGHYGVYHKMSDQHLHRYCDEFSFRWDHRKETDEDRTEEAIEQAAGKRLTYRHLVDEDRKRLNPTFPRSSASSPPSPR